MTVGLGRTGVETIYGADVLGELPVLPCAVITSPSAWRLVAARVPSSPATVQMPSDPEESTLEALVAALPADAAIVGVGGGTALDAAKYAAHRLGRALVLVPTLTSTNTPFTDTIALRRGGRAVGLRLARGTLPRRVLVDGGLIAAAPPRLNRAGYADVLYVHTALEDWRSAAARGVGAAFDGAVGAAAAAIVERTIGSAATVGKMDRGGAEELMRLFEAAASLDAAPLMAGSEHLFAWNLEASSARPIVHGEAVALGLVIASHLQANAADRVTTALHDARVAYRPDSIGAQRDEVARALRTVQEYNAEVRHLHTVFDRVRWTDALLDEVIGIAYD